MRYKNLAIPFSKVSFQLVSVTIQEADLIDALQKPCVTKIPFSKVSFQLVSVTIFVLLELSDSLCDFCLTTRSYKLTNMAAANVKLSGILLYF